MVFSVPADEFVLVEELLPALEKFKFTHFASLRYDTRGYYPETKNEVVEKLKSISKSFILFKSDDGIAPHYHALARISGDLSDFEEHSHTHTVSRTYTRYGLIWRAPKKRGKTRHTNLHLSRLYDYYYPNLRIPLSYILGEQNVQKPQVKAYIYENAAISARASIAGWIPLLETSLEGSSSYLSPLLVGRLRTDGNALEVRSIRAPNLSAESVRKAAIEKKIQFKTKKEASLKSSLKIFSILRRSLSSTAIIFNAAQNLERQYLLF